jgi:hypothetical protein
MFQNKKEKALQGFARAGLVAKGLVYCLIGLLSVLAAFGQTNRKGDKTNVFELIKEQPFGQVVVVIVAVCLLGFVTLRLLQTFAFTGDKHPGTKGKFKRIGYAVSALIYLTLSFYAFKLALGSQESGDTKKFFVSILMDYNAGRFVVGAIGLIIMGNGCYHFSRGVTSRFMKKVELHKSEFKNTFKVFGIVGYAAKGIVLGIIGYFLLRAALDANPDEAEGTGEAFDFLKNKGGNILMGIVSIGMIAYGIFMFVRARHEKIRFDI